MPKVNPQPMTRDWIATQARLLEQHASQIRAVVDRLAEHEIEEIVSHAGPSMKLAMQRLKAFDEAIRAATIQAIVDLPEEQVLKVARKSRK